MPPACCARQEIPCLGGRMQGTTQQLHQHQFCCADPGHAGELCRACGGAAGGPQPERAAHGRHADHRHLRAGAGGCGFVQATGKPRQWGSSSTHGASSGIAAVLFWPLIYSSYLGFKLSSFPRQVPTLCKVLRSLTMASFSPDYDVGGIADPFLQARGKGDKLR